MKLLEEVRKGKRRWFLAATALLLLSSRLATTAFLLSYEEGYPTWEELVDQIKEAEQSDSRLVRVKVVGRCVHFFTVMHRPCHTGFRFLDSR